MKITILTSGTLGDTQPYIALGIELKKLGYTILIAAQENFGDLITKRGVEFYPIKGDMTKVMESDTAKEAMNADSSRKFYKSLDNERTIAQWVDIHRGLYEACKGTDAVIFHPAGVIGYFIAEHLNIPSILAVPYPITPTKERPALAFYGTVRIGKTLNFLTYKIIERAFWSFFSKSIKRFWMNEFCYVPKSFGCPFGKQGTKMLPTITSCSNFVFPRPKDWPEYAYNTGYWFLDEADWRPSDELLDFLNNGAPPVYVGFGSMVDASKAAQMTEIIIDAIKISKQRAILAAEWGGMTKVKNIPENILFLQSAPHSWLFPRMAVVIHHGGAGTTAAGFKAGIPSVIIPFHTDQFAWGRRVYELGVGSKPIPRKYLTAENLSEAILYALQDKIKEASKTLGLKIQSENGAKKAAEIVHNYLSR